MFDVTSLARYCEQSKTRNFHKKLKLDCLLNSANQNRLWHIYCKLPANQKWWLSHVRSSSHYPTWYVYVWMEKLCASQHKLAQPILPTDRVNDLLLSCWNHTMGLFCRKKSLQKCRLGAYYVSNSRLWHKQFMTIFRVTFCVDKATKKNWFPVTRPTLILTPDPMKKRCRGADDGRSINYSSGPTQGSLSVSVIASCYHGPCSVCVVI
jgi:hypothetical protein